MQVTLLLKALKGIIVRSSAWRWLTFNTEMPLVMWLFLKPQEYSVGRVSLEKVTSAEGRSWNLSPCSCCPAIYLLPVWWNITLPSVVSFLKDEHFAKTARNRLSPHDPFSSPHGDRGPATLHSSSSMWALLNECWGMCRINGDLLLHPKLISS